MFVANNLDTGVIAPPPVIAEQYSTKAGRASLPLEVYCTAPL